MIDPFPNEIEPDGLLCSEIYGSGRWQYDFDERVREGIKEFGLVLNLLVSNLEQEDIQKLPLLWLEGVDVNTNVVLVLILHLKFFVFRRRVCLFLVLKVLFWVLRIMCEM